MIKNFKKLMMPITKLLNINLKIPLNNLNGDC
jgi:hypothetical protein